MTTSTIVRPADPALRDALRLALVFAAAKLVLQFVLTLWTSHVGYGYFRDEFYYIACGRHLAWGFVDHGPIVAVQARVGELLFGDSVFAIRIFSAVAGAVMVFLTGVIAWAMDGRRPAQALAMFGVIVCPQYIGTDGYLSMNSFEPVFWMICALALLMMLRRASERRWWIVFGVAAGVGLLNKPSMAFFLVAVGVGLLVTSQRKVLFSRWAAVGIALLILIALPNVVWQVHHHWPTLEFLHNGQIRHKNVALNPLQFLLAQVSTMQPVNSLIWITGVVSLLRAKSIRDGRWLGIGYVVFFVAMAGMHAKDYYLAGIYPAPFAAGAIAWERKFANSGGVVRNRVVAFPVFEGVLLVTSVLILPMASPVLRPEAWIRYTSAMHLHGDKMETSATGPLPQFYADRFGWDQLTNDVVSTYRSLSKEDQKQACLVMTNYGEAGALDLLGRKMEPSLPPAIADQNSYWDWGTHGCNWQVVIFVGDATLEEMNARYESVQLVGHLDDPYAMPFEHKPVYLARRRKPSMRVDWADWKDYI